MCVYQCKILYVGVYFGVYCLCACLFLRFELATVVQCGQCKLCIFVTLDAFRVLARCCIG